MRLNSTFLAVFAAVAFAGAVVIALGPIGIGRDFTFVMPTDVAAR